MIYLVASLTLGLALFICKRRKKEVTLKHSNFTLSKR